MTADPRALFERMAEVLNRHEWDRFPEVFADDWVLEYPQSGELFRGLDKVRASFQKRGGAQHQALTADVVDLIESRPGWTARQEVRIDTPGGARGSRYGDVGAYDEAGNLREIHQVGRETLGGIPVARERYAFDDMLGARPDLEYYWHPYN